MQQHTYLHRIFFDTQRKRYTIVEEVAIDSQSALLRTADDQLIKVFHSLSHPKEMNDKLEWLMALGAKDAMLSSLLAMPTAILTGLKRNEAGYVCTPTEQHNLNDYIKPRNGEKLFKWYYEATGGITFRLRLAYHIATCLQQIHQRGICLVDMCPANTTLQPFSVTSPDVPRIQFISADAICSYTQHAQSSGVPRYSDPLVCQHRHSPSTISDTFSFAVMIFELFTTCHPFEGEDAELLSHEEFHKELAEGTLDYIGDKQSAYNKNEIFEDTQLFLPENLSILFQRMFTVGKTNAALRPTLDDFKSACLQALKQIIKCDHIGCGKDYPYQPNHICPFCNHKTNRVILARLQKTISASEKMLFPHDGITEFSALPVLTTTPNFMVLHPGLNKITQSFFEPDSKNDKDSVCILIRYSPAVKRITIRNRLTNLRIKVMDKVLLPYTGTDQGKNSDMQIPEDKLFVIEFPNNAQIVPERIIPVENDGYGTIQHKWRIFIGVKETL